MCVGGIWRCRFNFGDEVLIKEDLADMGDIAATIRSVVVDGAIKVGKDVDVVCPRSVMAWEQGGELSNSEIVCRVLAVGTLKCLAGDLGLRVTCGLQTTQKSLIDVCTVLGTISIARSDDARVDASGVAVPDLNHGIRNRVAGVHVNDLGVKNQLHPSLILDNVFSHILSAHIAGSLCYLGAENARVVARKNDALGRGTVVALGRQMSGVENCRFVTSFDKWCISGKATICASCFG